jgi:hypothetical protein
MASEQLAIHIPPEATPTNIAAMLQAMAENEVEFTSVDDLVQFMMEADIGTRTEIQTMAERLGLLDKQKNAISISRIGSLLAQLKPAILPDILHFRLYTGWNEANPRNFLPAWAYRWICDHFWNLGEFKLSDESNERLVSEIIVQAETAFTELGFDSLDSVSFSGKSLRGARRWLDALMPTVIDKNVFVRRSFCPPELLLLAIGWVFQNEPDPIGVPLLLSRPQREAICRLCLLDPKYFDRTLDWLIPRYPKVIVSEDKAGFYGRSIRLRKLPELEDLLS